MSMSPTTPSSSTTSTVSVIPTGSVTVRSASTVRATVSVIPTASVIVAWAVLTGVAASVIPALVGLAGGGYLLAALVLGLGLLWFSVVFARRDSVEAARRLLVASVAYVPLLLIAMLLDRAG